MLEVLSDNSHAVGATAAIYSHLTVTNAHRQGQKIMATDGECHRDHSKLKLIADRGEGKPLAQILRATGAPLEGCNTVPLRNYIIRHFVNEKKMLPRVQLWDF